MKRNHDAPLISVIVAAYNAEPYISKCIESIRCQTFEEFEIVAVDDGSTDRTGTVLDEYASADTRIKVIHQKNQGAGLAKNTGISFAQGDYIAFVDADDWIEPTTLEEIYRETNEGEVDMVVYNHNRIYPDRVQRNVRKVKEELIRLDELGVEKYIMRYMISFTHEYGAWNKLVKRKIVEENNIQFSDNKKTVYDDNLYCLKLICHVNTIRAINKAFYNYNIHEGSVSDMKNTYEKIAMGYTAMLNQFREYVYSLGRWGEWKNVFPLLYYSMVFFGLTRMKRFGGLDISGAGEKLGGTENYLEYMEQINKFSVRFKYITQTIPGIGTIRNWQLIGLLILTLVQGKLIASNALKGNYKRVDFWI